jgi:carbonic anhydrase/acetyltransferase-like protein (isoleucine patch superfamily)
MIYTLGERKPEIADDAWVAGNATLIGACRLAARSSVWFNCVLRGDNDELIVGPDSNVQDGSILHTDAGKKLVIGRGCTIGHMVMLHGCTLEDHVLVGIGSIVLNDAYIGAESIVAANSVVTERKRFPPGVMLMGAPAKVVRELSAEERARIHWSADHYVENARRFREQLRPLPA